MQQLLHLRSLASLKTAHPISKISSMANLLTKYDLSKTEWEPLPDGTPGRMRILSGAEIVEDIWNRLFKGYQTLFFAVYLDVSAIPIRDVTAACREAWKWLRYNIPTIAAPVEVDEKDVSRFVYHAATPELVEAWADRTCIVDMQDVVDLDALRELVCGAKVPSADGDATWLHVVIPKNTESISKLGFLLHTHHAPFDGTALKFIFNRYLGQLAKILGSSTYVPESLPWGKEIDNLLPAALNALASHEPRPIPTSSEETPTANHPYYESLLMAMEAMGTTFPNPNLWGFRYREADPGWPICAREEVTLSKTESDAVMDTLKKLKKDHAFTLTHLVHAALAMVVINDNPPTPDQSSGVIAPQALANCRDRLKEPYASRNGYAGYALGVSAIRIPVKIFMEDDATLLPMSKETLIKACSHIREEYKLQRELPAILSYMDQGSQVLAGGMKAGALANAIPPDQCYKFSSDGKGETLLQGVYLDTEGRQLFEISKWFTALNRVDPAPFFRFFSWKGCIILSSDVNKNVISLEDTKGYMQKWKEYIMLITK